MELNDLQYRKLWIKRIWAHRRMAKESPDKYWQTDFWECVRGTIALLLDNQLPEHQIDEELGAREDIAWNELGVYYTDYGDGKAFEALAVRGFKYFIYEDGNL